MARSKIPPQEKPVPILKCVYSAPHPRSVVSQPSRSNPRGFTVAKGWVPTPEEAPWAAAFPDMDLDTARLCIMASALRATRRPPIVLRVIAGGER